MGKINLIVYGQYTMANRAVRLELQECVYRYATGQYSTGLLGTGVQTHMG